MLTTVGMPRSATRGGTSVAQTPPRAGRTALSDPPPTVSLRPRAAGGPVGANGSRPLLQHSWAQRAAAANAASTPTLPGRGAAGGGCGGQPSTGQVGQRAANPGADAAQPAQRMDEDEVAMGHPGHRGDVADEDEGEFITVQRRRRGAAARAAAGQSSADAAVAPTRGGAGDSVNAPAGGDAGTRMDGVEDGMDADDDWELDDDDVGQEPREDEDQRQPSPQDLWRELQVERDELRTLRRKWGDSHWTVHAARQRVEAAEDLWRSEKPATMPSRVLQRAEQSVRKAEERVSQTLEKIQKLDTEYQAKRAGLEEDLEDERGKLRECRTRLGQAQADVGAAARRVNDDGGDEAQHDQDRAAERRVLAASADQIQLHIAPQLAAAVEAVEAGATTEAVRQQLHSVLACITDVHGAMQQQVEAPERQRRWHYDIADDESDLPELDAEDWRRCGGGWSEWGSRHHEYQGYQAAQVGYGHGGGGHWGGGHSYGHDYGCSWYWAGDQRSGDDSGPPRSKRWRADAEAFADAMEEQEPRDMQVPAHLEDGAGPREQGAAAGSAASAAAAMAATGAGAAEATAGGGASAQDAQLLGMVEAFRKTAGERGVDISDISMDGITAAQLQLLATARFG